MFEISIINNYWKMKYRVKKVVDRVSLRSCNEMISDDFGLGFVEYVYWCVQVHVFAWIWVTVTTYRSDVFEREGELEDYGEWLAHELKDKLEEEEE